MSTTSTDTYDQIGIREDLTNVIWDVTPTETPFLSNAARVKAKQTLHEWQTDSLAAVSTSTAVEGADASFSAASATTRVGNRTEIIEKTAQISGTLEATDRAGRQREMAYQLVKRGKEIKRDMEHHLVGVNQAAVTGSATVARNLGSYSSWVATNDIFGSGGVSPTGDGTDARTDGTQAAFTETMLEDGIDLIFNSGGDPDIILAGSFNKRKITNFVGNSDTQNLETAAKHIVNAVSVYESDYGSMMVVPDRFVRSRDVLVYQKSFWNIAMLRDMQTEDIAKTGDSDKKQILVEYTLEAGNEASSGGVFDLTTS